MVRNLFLIITIFLTQCSVVPIIPIAIDDIVLKVEETKEKKTTSTKLIEKPYQINGKWFYPRDYKFFEEIGIANTLNDIRTGDKTRNGEVYHDEIMMGSHRSLPLPSLIKVTNLSNGYSVRVRVNHRGAFSNTNVINLSSAVFDILDMKKSGELVKISLIYQNETYQTDLLSDLQIF